jgi:exodeoxyribonuclease VII small subunit
MTVSPDNVGKEQRVAAKAKKDTPDTGTNEALPFEDALTRLEEIVATLESGDPSLETSLALFEEGVALSRRCNKRLDTAERRLELLVGQGAGGDVEPLDENEFVNDDDDGDTAG